MFGNKYIKNYENLSSYVRSNHLYKDGQYLTQKTPNMCTRVGALVAIVEAFCPVAQDARLDEYGKDCSALISGNSGVISVCDL